MYMYNTWKYVLLLCNLTQSTKVLSDARSALPFDNVTDRYRHTSIPWKSGTISLHTSDNGFIVRLSQLDVGVTISTYCRASNVKILPVSFTRDFPEDPGEILESHGPERQQDPSSRQFHCWICEANGHSIAYLGLVAYMVEDGPWWQSLSPRTTRGPTYSRQPTAPRQTSAWNRNPQKRAMAKLKPTSGVAPKQSSGAGQILAERSPPHSTSQKGGQKLPSSEIIRHRLVLLRLVASTSQFFQGIRESDPFSAVT
ncbi:uncharacterized protein B0T15DRAFT_508041 [Chaetomium strumarium]|uniref:Uncharacterized protein n=1 Tax=Chaetomium strumarium TaxID=1170767 RepID=A0AAJ0H4A9_9PEZI|nr:hypothetical protein B0T15DRAFT_508041 [Chaetomium strumarium]